MAMVVKNNMSAISTLNTLNRNSASLTKSLQKVSSGMRINGAADDASGYAISERMRVQIRSLDQDNRNTQNGNSMMKVAEGAVSSTVEILKTLKEKVINAANDTNTDSDRATIQKELDQSIDQIDDNANMTYNGKYLVDGSKNKVGDATYTSLTNQNLSTDTTSSTKLTDLKARSGDDLQLQSTDKITVSYVQQGKTHSTTFEVGDKTLQDIFNEAENIDTTSKTFASADNKSVATALDASQANSGDANAVKNAVNYLRAALGNDVTSSAGKQLKFSSETSFALAASASAIENDAATGAPLEVSTIDGEITKSLKESATAASIAWSTMDANGKTLKSALTQAQPTFTWDGNPASLETNEAQNLINSSTDEVKAAYATYKESVQKFEDAKQTAKDKLTDYNNKTQQLAALTYEKDYYDKRAAYDDAVDVALRGFEKSAGDSSLAVEYKDADGNVHSSAANDPNRGTFVKDMISNLREQYSQADLAKADSATDRRTPGGITAGVQIASTSAPTTPAALDGNDAANFTAISTAQGNVKTAYEKLDKANNAGFNVNGTDIQEALETAHKDILTKFDGPQLLTGSGIGVSASGSKVSTASGQNAVTITAANEGVNGQIAGFTIGITDKDGNTKKSAEAALDAFDETIRAQNKSEDNAISLQIGTKANQTIKVGLTDMRSQALGLKGSDGSTLNIGTREYANAAINVLDNALQKALDQQTTIGAVQSRLEYTSSNLTTASENVTASESTIRDADMAKEMTEYTKNNVLLQAAQSMLSQANQNSSAVLSLLQ